MEIKDDKSNRLQLLIVSNRKSLKCSMRKTLKNESFVYFVLNIFSRRLQGMKTDCNIGVGSTCPIIFIFKLEDGFPGQKGIGRKISQRENAKILYRSET